DLAEQPRGSIVEQRVGGVVIPRRIEAPAADPRRQKCQDGERSELQRDRQTQGQTEDSRRDSGGADEDQRKPRRDQLRDQQQNAADQPQPRGVGGKSAHSPPLGTLATALGFGGDGGVSPPIASLASSPIPPRVPINWVASTGNRIVFALGDRANSAT